MYMNIKARLFIIVSFHIEVLQDHGLSKSSKFFIFYKDAQGPKIAICTKAFEWSGSFIFNPIDLKIGMHSNGGIGNNIYF